MNKKDKIYVAGHRGLVGSAITRKLLSLGFDNLLIRTKDELDLTDQAQVRKFFAEKKPDYVFLAAARVGGIAANSTYPAEFIYQNLSIQNNVIHSAYLSGVKKLMFLGSSCIYPKEAKQPMSEDALLTGPLEKTNEAYAVAKIAGLEMCRHYCAQYGVKFISVMPTNLYGPNDNFDLANSHVLPALIRRFHEAKIGNAPHIIIWGTGEPYREFMHADDMSDACVFLMENYDEPNFVNIGTGKDLKISELARLIAKCVGYEGEIRFDPTKPDGPRRKLLDISKLSKLGWSAKIPLEQGIKETYAWYVKNLNNLKI